MKIKQLRYYSDAERLIELGHQMHQESPAYRHIDYDYDKLRGYARMAIETPSQMGIFFAEQNNEAIAMVAMFVAEKYFSTTYKEAHDLFLYAKPGRRGGLAAARCMQAIERWAKNHDIKALNMSVSAGIDDEGAVRFYDGMGYKQSAVTMTKEVV